MNRKELQVMLHSVQQLEYPQNQQEIIDNTPSVGYCLQREVGFYIWPKLYQIILREIWNQLKIRTVKSWLLSVVVCSCSFVLCQ